MREREILHCDINYCYAQIEENRQPQLKRVPLAVGGSAQERRGIILAKNPLAAQSGVKTGETLQEALGKCPSLHIVPPDFDRYRWYGEQVKKLYRGYSDQVEDYGLDEAWLDVTGCRRLWGSGWQIAHQIQRQVEKQIGLTISVGLSYNKVFAKMASDLIKPKGLVQITRQNFQQVLYPLPVSHLFYVGEATRRKLAVYGIRTIGDLARQDEEKMRQRFGRTGVMLLCFARGEEDSEVASGDAPTPVCSIGHSITAIHDLHDAAQAVLVLRPLAEAVALRLRRQNKKGYGIALSLRDGQLRRWSLRRKRPRPTQLAIEILQEAQALLERGWSSGQPLRSLGISVFDLVDEDSEEQLSLFEDETARQKQRKLEETIDLIRERFGYHRIRHCDLLLDEALTGFNPLDSTVHPTGWRKRAGGKQK